MLSGEGWTCHRRPKVGSMNRRRRGTGRRWRRAAHPARLTRMPRSPPFKPRSPGLTPRRMTTAEAAPPLRLLPCWNATARASRHRRTTTVRTNHGSREPKPGAGLSRLRLTKRHVRTGPARLPLSWQAGLAPCKARFALRPCPALPGPPSSAGDGGSEGHAGAGEFTGGAAAPLSPPD